MIGATGSRTQKGTSLTFVKLTFPCRIEWAEAGDGIPLAPRNINKQGPRISPQPLGAKPRRSKRTCAVNQRSRSCSALP